MGDRYEFLYENAKTEGLMTKAAVDAALKDWEIIEAFDLNGELIGTVLALGSEVHVVAKPSHYKRCISRRNAKKLLWPIFDRMGFLTTRTRITSHSKQRFIERFGFQKTWSDDRFVYYMMTEKPYA